jgi:YD repeat-containing protein
MHNHHRSQSMAMQAQHGLKRNSQKFFGLSIQLLAGLLMLLTVQTAWAGCEREDEWLFYNPTVSITAPANGASFYAPASITLTANPSTIAGTITKVEFYNNTTLLGSATAAPWQFVWSNVAVGSYALKARVYDTCRHPTPSLKGRTGGSATVNITVAPPYGPIQGNIDGVTTGSDGKPYLAGWACDKNVAQSVAVHMYRVAAGVNTYVGAYTANQASEAGVSAACGTSGVAHRFSIALAGLEPYENQALNVYGISTIGGVNNALGNSGGYKIPAAPPVVSLSMNAGNMAPARAALEASATDTSGIKQVEFISGSTVLATVLAPPYRFDWKDIAAGTYSVQARATDILNAVATTPAQTFTVGAAPVFPAVNTTATRTSSFDYDPASGVLIKEVVEPGNSNLCLVTTYAHDKWGNTSSTTTRNCNGSATQTAGGVAEAAAPTGDPVVAARTATTEFDARGQFATKVTNAVGHTETRQYDARFGQMVGLTGPNGLTTTWAYDSFGRKRTETRPDGTSTSWTYTDKNGVDGGACAADTITQWAYYTAPFYICYQLIQHDYASGGAQIGREQYTYFDQANRKILSYRRNFANTDWIAQGLTHMIR